MHFFLVNPVSGKGRGERVWKQIKKILDQRSLPHLVEWTRHRNHATEIARMASSRTDIQAVVVIGGDGTVHEAGNGMVGTKMPMGYIPAGSGNDFALAHNIPSHPEHALNRVLCHEACLIDTADIHGKAMIGFAGIGFDGKVAETVNHSPFKRWLGKSAYLFAALQTWARYQPAQVTLTVDGQEFSCPGTWLIAVTNIPNYGGGMRICPQADNKDGYLDICCVHRLSHSRFLKIFPSVFRGNHIRHPEIDMQRGTMVSVTSDPPLTVHADGEIIGKTPLSIRIRPQSLALL